MTQQVIGAGKLLRAGSQTIGPRWWQLTLPDRKIFWPASTPVVGRGHAPKTRALR